MKCRLRQAISAIGCMALMGVTGFAMGPRVSADPNSEVPLPDPPSDSYLITPMPVVTPIVSGWTPKYPFPYDQMKDRVTDADVTAMREMCQWYNAQYATLRFQIDRLQTNRIDDYGRDFDYSQGDVQQQVDIVTGNIRQAVDFLTPRVQSLSQPQNTFGDHYFVIYEGEAFYKLWEQLSNVNNGILAHQPDWFTGPSVQKAKRWGSDIHRSHVCEG